MHHPHPRHVRRRQDQHHHLLGCHLPINPLSDTAIAFSIKMDNRSALGFLPGQYVNIQVPGTDQARSFSFSSGPSSDEVGFLIRNTSHGVLTTYLRDRAKTGDRIEFNGPLGSFYLREIKRPAAVPGRRYRSGAVPVDARQDRGPAANTRST